MARKLRQNEIVYPFDWTECVHPGFDWETRFRVDGLHASADFEPRLPAASPEAAPKESDG